jgi:hypothetical protein
MVQTSYLRKERECPILSRTILNSSDEDDEIEVLLLPWLGLLGSRAFTCRGSSTKRPRKNPMTRPGKRFSGRRPEASHELGFGFCFGFRLSCSTATKEFVPRLDGFRESPQQCQTVRQRKSSSAGI